MSKAIKRLAGFASLLVAAAMTMVVVAPNGNTAEPTFPKMNIRLGTVAVGEPFYHKGSLKFSELVKERTQGAVNVQVIPGGQLGNEKDLFEQVKIGVIEMTIGGTPMLSIFPGWEAVGAFAMPYVFKGDDEKAQFANFLKIARGAIGREIAEQGVKATGMRTLDLGWWAGVQHLATRAKQVTKVEDIKGLKIRSADTPIYRAALTALGAAVIPMSWSEVYTALQLGVVDGMTNTPDIIYNAKLNEVQKFLALTGHLTQIQTAIINNKFYQGLSPELRAVLDKAAVDAGDYQNGLAMKGNAQYLEKLKAQGMTISPVNIAEFTERTKNAWKTFEPQFGVGFYEKVLAAQR
jgi:tripartite ATP-independent transporter DctP family solute receptor